MAPQALAHDPGLSSANLEVEEHAITLLLTFNAREVASLNGGSATDQLETTGRRAVVLQVDGSEQQPTTFTAALDANNNAEFRYSFPRAGSEISFDSLLLKDLSFGHRQAFAARAANGAEIARRILSGRNSVAVFRVEPAPSRSSAFFGEFLRLGIHHILTGYDHLLFLFALLIVCRDLRTAAVLISCFTLAHSLTLALSTFGLVSLPSRYVEAAIAASILYVGVENLLRGDSLLRGRWLLTFGFGLIHGLGFAGVLREMGVAQTGAAAVIPLLAFNGGVEVGQLAVAAVVLPLIWTLRKRPAFLRVGVPACSVLVVLAGGYWLIERTIFS